MYKNQFLSVNQNGKTDPLMAVMPFCFFLMEKCLTFCKNKIWVP